jgi:hypothetical protein
MFLLKVIVTWPFIDIELIKAVNVPLGFYELSSLSISGYGVILTI